jgi:hypothetical protein
VGKLTKNQAWDTSLATWSIWLPPFLAFVKPSEEAACFTHVAERTLAITKGAAMPWPRPRPHLAPVQVQPPMEHDVAEGESLARMRVRGSSNHR